MQIGIEGITKFDYENTEIKAFALKGKGIFLFYMVDNGGGFISLDAFTAKTYKSAKKQYLEMLDSM